ncbi:hypothetical protein C8R46DRAFT_1313972 [Mycena filopes]|nr:hypothetical protein C8R46DRAFT_1313972 [Mycena filopes]
MSSRRALHCTKNLRFCSVSLLHVSILGGPPDHSSFISLGGRRARAGARYSHPASQLEPQFQFLPPAYTHDAWYDAQLYGAPAPTSYTPRGDGVTRDADGDAAVRHSAQDPRPHTNRPPAQPAFSPRPPHFAASSSATSQHPSSAAPFPRLAPSALDGLIPMPPRFLRRMAFGPEEERARGFDTHAAAPYAHPQPHLHHHDAPRKLHPNGPRTVLRAASAASFHLPGRGEEEVEQEERMRTVSSDGERFRWVLELGLIQQAEALMRPRLGSSVSAAALDYSLCFSPRYLTQ